MKKITGKLSLQWRLTLITALLMTVTCILMYFFISQSAVAGMEDLGDYMIRIDNTDSAPITFISGAFQSAAANKKAFSHQRTHGNRNHHPSQQYLHIFYQPSGITSSAQTQPGGEQNRGPEPLRGS